MLTLSAKWQIAESLGKPIKVFAILDFRLAHLNEIPVRIFPELKSHADQFFSKNRFHQTIEKSRDRQNRPIPRRFSWNKSELWKKILHRTLHHFND